MKIDISAHIVPKKYYEAVCKKAAGKVASWAENTALIHLDVRLRVLEMYPDVMQVLTVAVPPLETLVSAGDSIDLAKIANDEMAEMVTKYPNKFLSAFACLPLSDIDAAVKEADRAITQLHFRGVQIATSINGEALDAPKFRPLYERMAQHDLPIWIHPWLHPKTEAGDFLKNPARGFGWPFETSAAMGYLAKSGVFEDFPNIKFITHHCGGMVPFFYRRIPNQNWGVTTGERSAQVYGNFRKFYADTAIYGNTSGLMCGYSYFGADHLLFGTDMPLGGGESSAGFLCTEETIRSVEQMDVPDTAKDKIFTENARRLLKVEP